MARFGRVFPIHPLVLKNKTFGRAYTKSFTETVTTSEPKFWKIITRPFSETITTSEPIFKKATTRLFNETISLSEPSFLRVRVKIFTELITLSEPIFTTLKVLVRSFTETITMSEPIFSKGTTKSFSDSITPTDNIQRSMTRKFTETITISEIYDQVRGKYLSFADDIITMSEHFTTIRTKIFVDTIVMSDKIWRWINGLLVSPWIKTARAMGDAWDKVAKPVTGIWSKINRTVVDWTKQDRPES